MNTVKTIQLRFKSPVASANTPASQSLLINRTGSDNGSFQFGLFLEYTGSLTSGSYSGSIVDPYYQYGTLKFISGSVSASTYLPFFDGGWWSVMVTQEGTGPYTYTLYTKNKIYNGDDGNTIGFQASSSLIDSGSWSKAGAVQIPGSGSATLNGQTYTPATASFQEVRYYSVALSESVFDDYVMNGDSIEGNGINSSYDQLFFRAPLGSELYTGSNSIHPSVNQTASFIDGTSAFSYTGSYNFISNVETAFYDQPAVGIKNAVSNKIRLENGTLYGTTLSGLASLQQNYPASESYTRNVNYLEVGYSPQNEINEDIMDSIGYFNIGDYIGDPRQFSSTDLVYPDLEELKKDYFKKYNKSYNYQDYFRIIKFYDNSLFKMIKDFIPARTAAATGAIVKQHLLERNRQRPAQLSWTRPEYSASVFSVARDYESGSIGVFEGGPAGAVNNWINVSQSYTASVLGPKGLVTYIESSEREFYNGAYSGSTVDVVNGKLQDNPLLGEAYRVSIPDLQNLNAEFASTINSITASLGNPATGKLPFTLETPAIDYYDNSTFEYTPAFDVVVDIELFITGVFVNTTSVEDSSLTIYLKEDGNVIGTSFDDNGNDNILINSITKNTLLKSGSTYTAEYRYNENDNPSNSTARLITESFWKINVQNLSAGSTYYLDPTVYAQQNFPGNLERFNAYNAIYNNVYSNRVSNKYFDVDYTNDALTPTNFGPIISQSALYAQIQDSNYDPKSAFFELRYSGTKYTSQNYNVFTEGDAQKDPAIDYYTDWFAYYDWIGGSNPQYPGGANFHLTRLINASTGEILTLDTANINLGLVESIFRQGDTPTQIVTAFSSVETSTDLIIATGGGLYNTILLKSGSADPALTSNIDIVYENPAYDGSGSLRTGTDELLSSITTNLITGSFGGSLVASASNANVTASFTTTWDYPNNWAVVTSVTVTGQAGFFYPTQQLIFPSASMGATTGNGLDLVITLNSGDLYTYDTTYDDIYFQTSSINTLIDTGSTPPYSAGWLSSMISGSSPALGKVIRYGFDNNIIQIFNKRTGQYITGGTDSVEYVDTYFPLQVGDFIRFGSDNGGTAGVDYEFSQQLYAIKTLNLGAYNDITSSLEVVPVITGSFPSAQNDQNFRIFRRVPNETFVVTKQFPANIGAGLLLPQNFNPDLDPLTVARGAGII